MSLGFGERDTLPSELMYRRILLGRYFASRATPRRKPRNKQQKQMPITAPKRPFVFSLTLSLEFIVIRPFSLNGLEYLRSSVASVGLRLWNTRKIAGILPQICQIESPVHLKGKKPSTHAIQ